jgi:nucleotide-binding universal stress UspA family protein
METSREGNRGREGRVIVGVDGSLGSLGALRRAVAEARQRGAQLCAVRVVTQDHPWVGLFPLVPQDLDLVTLREGVASAFHDALGEVPSDLRVSSLVLVGSPGPALVDFAHRDDDLLVVGAGERSGVGRWWRGSVSGYCVRHARCPVLSVPLPEFARSMRHVRLPRGRVGLDELLDA